MSTDDNTLEGALDDIGRQADATVRALSSALKEAKRAKAAAGSGQLRELRQALAGSARLSAEAASTARGVADGWTFDEQAYFGGGGYTKELLALATEEGVKAFESDDRILSYPVIVAVSATDATVSIDRRKEARVRPSVLVKALRSLQAKPPKFKAESFLEALAIAYDLVCGRKGGRRGAVVKLVDVYGVLTLLPGSARDYSKQEFARDLYLLDQSGVTTTRSGRTLHLPASALTRGSGVLATVSQSGQEKVYAGISFEDPAG